MKSAIERGTLHRILSSWNALPSCWFRLSVSEVVTHVGEEYLRWEHITIRVDPEENDRFMATIELVYCKSKK
jgi:hypothetical protein